MREPIAAFLWIGMPLFVAAGASVLTAVLMHARSQIAMARHREADVRARLSFAQQLFEERIEATGEAARRQALEEFLGDVRVEERCGKLLVLQRVCFRNIPLTPWISGGAMALAGPDLRAVSTEVLEIAPRRLLG
jgi:hypothetical protein